MNTPDDPKLSKETEYQSWANRMRDLIARSERLSESDRVYSRKIQKRKKTNAIKLAIISSRPMRRLNKKERAAAKMIVFGIWTHLPKTSFTRYRRFAEQRIFRATSQAHSTKKVRWLVDSYGRQEASRATAHVRLIVERIELNRKCPSPSQARKDGLALPLKEKE